MRLHRGFSIIELVVVVVIIATATAVAMPRYAGSRGHYRVELAARKLVHDLGYAATLARVTSAEVTVKFEKGHKPDESYYYFEGIEDPDRPGQVYTVVLRETPWKVVLADAPGDITYLPSGLPKDSRTFVLQTGGHQRTVLVDKTTGEITVQ